MSGQLKQAIENATSLVQSGSLSLFTNPQVIQSFSPIAPHVYVGSRESALKNANILKSKYGISQVVSVSMLPVLTTGDKEGSLTPAVVQWHSYPLNDVVQQPLIAHASFIHQTHLAPAKASGAIVLVVCDYGISRSVSVVIYHLMQSYGWTYDQALCWMKKRRSCACPNQGFEQQLRLCGLK
jgi:protein-tyrosine phosphatase